MRLNCSRGFVVVLCEVTNQKRCNIVTFDKFFPGYDLLWDVPPFCLYLVAGLVPCIVVIVIGGQFLAFLFWLNTRSAYRLPLRRRARTSLRVFEEVEFNWKNRAICVITSGFGLRISFLVYTVRTGLSTKVFLWRTSNISVTDLNFFLSNFAPPRESNWKASVAIEDDMQVCKSKLFLSEGQGPERRVGHGTWSI